MSSIHPATPDTADTLPDELVDVAVLGGGAAGLNAALMLVRSRRSVLVLDTGDPRNAPAAGIHGLLGREGMAPAELLARGRAEVRSYGGLVVSARVAAARADRPAADGDLRFTVDLADGRVVTARRLLLATGVRDELPAIPGLAEHWGRGLVHCPYCHGWEVRDQAIGVLAVGPASAHQALLFRQLSDDVTVFSRGTRFEEETLERFAALGITVIDGAVERVEAAADGSLAGVRLADGTLVQRDVLAVASRVYPRLDGLGDLGLPLEELPGGFGEKVVTTMGGATGVPGIWAAGNLADPMAQVGASAAAGALAGAHLNASLVSDEADAAVARRTAVGV
ncbi:NAD(P)/FAD-dependent oxidoreductase [Brachybacterium sp. J153]|uniref:NAD(P)/FAD-dependent oxidoreductase n=1 Tax=Brachybacterium sp. J153 TaxID=3116488 RepID=UPI002E7A12F2|nr:NAD(P)/FAD-dependent oxidoreductase [Brachybacterium sp. J153]MEE1619615.1 NAD(P)/FAD-dependent oxidoreductase [Brachybacterium sp. J153]